MKKTKSGRKFTKSRKTMSELISNVQKYRELVNQEYNMMHNSLTFMTNDEKGIEEILVKASENHENTKEITEFKKAISALFEEKYGRKPGMNYIHVQLGSAVNRIDTEFTAIYFNKDLRKSEIQDILEITDDDNKKPFHKWTKFTFETLDVDKYIESIIERGKKLYKVDLAVDETKTAMADMIKKIDLIRKIWDEEKETIAKTEDLNTLIGFLV